MLLIVAAAAASAAFFAAPPPAAPTNLQDTTVPVQDVAEPEPLATTTAALPATEPALEPTASAQPQAEAEPVELVAVPEPTASGLSDTDLNAAARAALVNIFCTTKAGGIFKPLSGSGVMIDSRGVILTNAHIAQYFLLRDYPHKDNIECAIRTGSPAQARYTAEPLYVSSAWIDANASQIDSKLAKGTGENDFALLYVTGAAEGVGPPPSSFAALPYKKSAASVGERMLLAAYPAGFLSGETIATNLYPTSAFTYVLKLFTFKDPKQIDLLSAGGSVVSQSGASGGAMVRTDGSLAGLIATAVLEGSTGERDLRAITMAHIDRSLAAAGLGSLSDLLSGNLATKTLDFNQDVAPALTKKLTDALED